jgi:hypothetical protein
MIRQRYNLRRGLPRPVCRLFCERDENASMSLVALMLLKPYRAGQRAHVGLGNMHHRIKVTLESLRQRPFFYADFENARHRRDGQLIQISRHLCIVSNQTFWRPRNNKKTERGARCSSVALAEGPVECAMGTLLNSTSDRQIGFPQRNPRRGVD